MPLENDIKKGFVIDLNKHLDNDFRPLLFDTLSSNTVFSEYIDFEYGIDQIKKSKSQYSFYSWVLFSLQLWALKYNNWSKSLAY